MSDLSSVNRVEVIRFYHRVNRLKPTLAEPAEERAGKAGACIEISAEAKKQSVINQAREEVLAKIKR